MLIKWSFLEQYEADNVKYSFIPENVSQIRHAYITDV